MPNIIEDDGYLLSTLEKIRQKLLDHTRRNRLLNYKETARDIAVIDEMADFVFEDLVLNDVRFNFSHYNRSDCEGEEANLVGELGPDRTLPETQTARGDVDGRYRDNILQTPFSSGELERRLRKLYSEHKTLIEETGANSLFLAMGFLEWSDSEDAAKPMLSPLLLVPVRLNRQGTAGQAKYDLSFDDEALDSNYSLIDKLRKNFDLNIPELGEEEKPESYWGRILDAVRGREEWRVRHEMALGLFKFNRQVMWHDLDPSRWPDHSPLVHKDVLRRILLKILINHTRQLTR